MGNNVVVLNSMQAASDLLDKRSALYSDRACPPMLGDSTLCVSYNRMIIILLNHFGRLNWAGFPTFVHYGDVWRTYRRMMNMWLNARSSVCFHQSQMYQTQLLLGRLLGAPNTTQSSKVLECEFSRCDFLYHMLLSIELTRRSIIGLWRRRFSNLLMGTASSRTTTRLLSEPRSRLNICVKL